MASICGRIASNIPATNWRRTHEAFRYLQRREAQVRVALDQMKIAVQSFLSFSNPTLVPATGPTEIPIRKLVEDLPLNGIQIVKMVEKDTEDEKIGQEASLTGVPLKISLKPTPLAERDPALQPARKAVVVTPILERQQEARGFQTIAKEDAGLPPLELPLPPALPTSPPSPNPSPAPAAPTLPPPPVPAPLPPSASIASVTSARNTLSASQSAASQSARTSTPKPETSNRIAKQSSKTWAVLKFTGVGVAGTIAGFVFSYFDAASMTPELAPHLFQAILGDILPITLGISVGIFYLSWGIWKVISWLRNRNK